MNKGENNEFVARCAGIATQRATNTAFSATNGRNDNATKSLKALACMILDRNKQGNNHATDTQKTAQQTGQKNTRFVARNCAESCVENNLIFAAECNPEIIAELRAEALPAIDGELLTDWKKPKIQVFEPDGEAPSMVVTHGDKWSVVEEAQYRDEPAKPAVNPYPKPVTCFTPTGEPMRVMAKSKDHEQFLAKVNPKLKPVSVAIVSTSHEGNIQCGNCQNFKPHHAYAHGKGSGICSANVQSSGLYSWSEAQHPCENYDTKG